MLSNSKTIFRAASLLLVFGFNDAVTLGTPKRRSSLLGQKQPKQFAAVLL